jgi:phage-related protein
MPLILSPGAYIEKNALASDGVWVILLEIYIPQLDDYIRVCSNNEDMTWSSLLWQSFPFQMDEIGDTTKGEIPQFAIKISNIDGVVQSYIEEADGGVGSSVKLMIINTNIDSTTPELELNFTTRSTGVDSKWATFTLGVESPYTILLGSRMIRTGCRFTGVNFSQNGFKGSRCKYSGWETECNKTLTRCRELRNTLNFGGFPGIGIGNTFYV